MIRIRGICTWSKSMASLTILSCRSATCFSSIFAQETWLRSAKTIFRNDACFIVKNSHKCSRSQTRFIFKHSCPVFRPSIKKRSKLYRIPMQLIVSRRPALFPSQKCYTKVRKKTKKLTHQKACALVKSCFFCIRLFSLNCMYGVIYHIENPHVASSTSILSRKKK